MEDLVAAGRAALRLLTLNLRACLLPHRAKGPARPQCHCSRCRLYRACVCPLPVSFSVTHRAAGSGSPQCHCTRCRTCTCAASGQSPLSSCTGQRGRAAKSFTTHCHCVHPGGSLLAATLLSLRAWPWGWVAKHFRGTRADALHPGCLSLF